MAISKYGGVATLVSFLFASYSVDWNDNGQIATQSFNSILSVQRCICVHIMCQIKGLMCLNPLMVLLLGLWILWIKISAQMHA